MNTNTKAIIANDDYRQREAIYKPSNDRRKEVKIDIPECRVHTYSSFKNKFRRKQSPSLSLEETKKEFYKEVAGLDPVVGESRKKKKCSSSYQKDEPRRESPFGKQRYWVYFIKEMQGNVPPSGAPLDYDPDSRNGFVRYVFLLVFIMLSMSAGIVGTIFYVEVLFDIFSDEFYTLMILIPCTIVIYIMGYVFGMSECSRHAPCNYFCLLIITLAQSLLTAVICCRYDVKPIILALVVTAVVVLLCLGLACTSMDFTKFYLYFVVIAFGVSLLSMAILIAMKVFGWKMRWLVIVILFVYVILSSISILMELQMILGGKTIEIGEEDYALAAYMLYSSIIELFRQLVQLLGELES